MLVDGGRSQERGAEGTAPPLTRCGQRPGLLLPSPLHLPSPSSSSHLLSSLPSSSSLLPSSSSSLPPLLPFPSLPPPLLLLPPLLLRAARPRKGRPGHGRYCRKWPAGTSQPPMGGRGKGGRAAGSCRGGARSAMGAVAGEAGVGRGRGRTRARGLGFWHPTSQLARNLLNFLPQPPHAITRRLDKFRDFWTSFAFYII